MSSDNGASAEAGVIDNSDANPTPREPSWDEVLLLGLDLDETSCLAVLRKAAKAARDEGRIVRAGDVTVGDDVDVQAHAVVKHATRARSRQCQRKAVRSFKNSASLKAMDAERQRALVASTSGAALGRLRACAELEKRASGGPASSHIAPSRRARSRDPPHERRASKQSLPRVSRRRTTSGMTALNILPFERVRARVRKQAVEDPGQPLLAMLAMGDGGCVILCNTSSGPLAQACAYIAWRTERARGWRLRTCDGPASLLTMRYLLHDPGQ